MARVTQGFTSSQLDAVKKVNTPGEIPSLCPQNFNLFSECFAAVAFNYLPTSNGDTKSIDYTIRADGGLFHIDVIRHTSDFEKKILPLQWAVDEVRLFFSFLLHKLNVCIGNYRAENWVTATNAT